MPAIFNIGNISQANEKKVSSKLTFEAGESFKGRIISKGEGNEVVVRLTDGWQFTAEVEGDIGDVEQGLVKFKVEDFEGGKLKLKIVSGGQSQQSSEGSIVGDFMEKSGMTKEDLDILKAMVKFSFPLTKENITFIKSIVAFNEKINAKPEEIEKFINNFLAGKGIEETSVKGQQIKDVLNDFFKSFKTVNKEDILFLLENDIDINKENIDSYKKLFKSEGTIKEYFDNISKSLKELNVDLPDTKPAIKNNEEAIISKTISTSDEKTAPGNNELASKIYDSNSTGKGKVSMLSLLKSMAGSGVEISKDTIKGVLIENENKFTTNDFNDKFSKLNSLSEKEFNDIIKTSLGNKRDINNDTVKAFISNFLGKEIDIPEADLQRIREIITIQMDDEVIPVKEGTVQGGKVLLEDGDMSRDVTQKDVSQKEVPQKDILQKELIEKDTIAATTKGVKGEVEGKIFNNEGSVIVEKKDLNGKPVINESITYEAEKEIKNVIAKEVLNLSSKDIIRDDMKFKIENMKDIIKDIIAHAELKGESLDKVMQFIKGNISDFKLLNSVNNEYYYLDIPIKNNGEEYPCKLIIKDSRKDNKKIDTTNVKLIVAVRTVNLGTVDGFLRVSGSSLNINIKCDEEFVKMVDKSKEKLLEGLQTLGFFTNITVTKKESEVSLTACREFFDEKHDRAIDIKV